jgi:sugar phosphate isomerase/epimerase
MWIESKHSAIKEETDMLFEKLHKLKAKTFGISVGDARRKKTEDELDAQANILRDIQTRAKAHNITCNLHNHTYEVTNDMHDLRGTLKRIPGFPLGPDLNWLIRGGVDPAAFIREFGKQVVYLHIRDQYLNGEWSESVGEGNTDFHGVANELEKIKFKGVATVELAFPKEFKPTRPLKESWKMSRQAVRKQFGY